jgi:hypothetical protein
MKLTRTMEQRLGAIHAAFDDLVRRSKEQAVKLANENCGVIAGPVTRNAAKWDAKLPVRSLFERVADRIVYVDKSECLEYPGTKTFAGYCQIRDLRTNGRPLAHRIVYETVVGPIPDGLDLDHLCMNRVCVNPDHLEPVTRAENTRRMWERMSPEVRAEQIRKMHAGRHRNKSQQ